MQTAKTKPVMADAEPKTPAVQEGKKMFKTRRQRTSSIGHEEGMEWRTKTFRTKRCCIRTELEEDDFSWYITPTGYKAEEKKRCSALTMGKTLTIDGTCGSKGGGWDARDDSEDSDEVYSDRQDSDDSNSDNRGL